MARNWNSDDREKVERCNLILDKIDKTLKGEDELTLILEDPFGNSAIISDEVFIEKMSENEAAQLKSGITVMELTGLSEEELGERAERGSF